MQQEEKATVIGESTFVTGSLSGDEDLTVLGRVEGSISLSQTLFVAESGTVKADVVVDDAVISGIVVGNVTATNSVQVTETGRLLGDLRAPRIMIVAGARVRGQVDMSGTGDGQRERDAAAEVRAQQRGAHGRFERLGLPARRPMPQAPTVARASQPAHTGAQASGQTNVQSGVHQRDAHAPYGEAQQRNAGQVRPARPSHHTPPARPQQAGAEDRQQDDGQHDEVQAMAQAHAGPRRAVSSHNKKRAAARRRD